MYAIWGKMVAINLGWPSFGSNVMLSFEKGDLLGLKERDLHVIPQYEITQVNENALKILQSTSDSNDYYGFKDLRMDDILAYSDLATFVYTSSYFQHPVPKWLSAYPIISKTSVDPDWTINFEFVGPMISETVTMSDEDAEFIKTLKDLK